ncbi:MULTISPECIES: adenylate/guanylate cyclase domain-containing protein [Mycobacterium]|uniref:Adenylate cyclase n=1 Tax=Mycobacterium gordonae TaxID=1778 RepID=A0A1A6B7R6_MYCGO|nr:MULTISPECIES: adenylate/guanylate cyclase domain-containing protein [Mycobacterium]MBI2697856.1 adenylate/guanylate cyclase domain-containing protein [Mycobacterium sp.]MCV7006235.1 adenylate/guanylate cyclase domain-containing protein [Mycobacterium gordonae]OBR98386.1 adenylate cyclase [Mycobacterium gordonae]ODR15679.1 adenylate cyclase [Mycobacterium gordonae]ORV81577.1 adenylate cyclase [Mycobacterium gordonae]
MALEARSAAAVPVTSRRRRLPPRMAAYPKSVARQQRVLTRASRIGAVVSAFYTLLGIFIGRDVLAITLLSAVSTVIYLGIPLLYRYGELVAPMVFIIAAYVFITVLCLRIGTGTGIQFYYLVGASIAVLVLGIDHIALASVAAAVGAVLTVALQLTVPENTGVQPDWAYAIGYMVSVATSWLMVIAIVWSALREITRAERVIEAEYLRSESLLANILPAKIAERLKDPSRTVIADKYDDASVLFADIAGFTSRASDTAPTDLVRFLDQLYTKLDALVDRHGLEKIKTSGDSYMVVSGVPDQRPDHLEALAQLALDMADAVADLKDPRGRAVPLRIGLAAGPVVAGVVGARKFFYDVWGDAVNVAARMETTDVEGRIQVPQDVYDRLKRDFVFEERGDIDVKGKGVMHTWYLVGRAPRR